MEYAFLGRSGLEVSRLTFGTMTFGGGDWYKHSGNQQLEEASKLVDICVEAGVNCFDTADGYSVGASEEVLGKAISKKRRDDIIISTKVFYPMGNGKHDLGLSRRHIIQACEASLKRLNTDYIDLYQLHEYDSMTPLEESLAALETLVDQGKVRYVGCSNFSGWHLMKALAIQDKRGFQPMISQQVYYSLAARELEDELVPLSLDQNVGMLIWSPLSFGLLSGKYRRNQPKPQNTRLAHWDTPGEVDYEKIYTIVDALDAIAKERGKTIAQIAINWLLQRPSVSSVIIGARNEEQLKENLGAIGWALTDSEMSRLNEVSLRTKPYPYWHQLLWSEGRNTDVANNRAKR